MAQFEYDVFISYSSKDKEWVRNDLLPGIESVGLRAFIDYRDFTRGAPSIKEIERGIMACRKTLLVLTPDYVESGWCEMESITVATLDPPNQDLRLIPLLKAHCAKPLRVSSLTHIDFTDGADWSLAWHQLYTALGQRQGEFSDSKGVVEKLHLEDICYLLLLIDQFPQGIWGASLEENAVKYGHQGDPGSVSVSTWCCIGLKQYCGEKLAPGSKEVIDRFGRYLSQRQHPVSGAFGMRKAEGTSKFPQYQIQEHGRHTATALRFCLFYFGYDHPAAKSALEYLLKMRTESGLWVDIGAREDRNTDPLTVAYVIEVLNYLLDTESGSLTKDLHDQISKAISRGFDYLFVNCNLRNQHGWIFKITDPSQRAEIEADVYSYTTDILACIAPACIKHPEYEGYRTEVQEMLKHLMRLAKKRHGLPCGPYSVKSNFDTTIYLIAGALFFEELRRDALMLYEELADSWHDATFMSESTAAGWATALLVNQLSQAPEREKVKQRMDQLGQAISRMASDRIVLPSEIQVLNKLIKDLATTKTSFASAEL